MRRMLATTTAYIVVLVIAALSARCTWKRSGGEVGTGALELTGTFDPYQCHDEQASHAVVLKERPDCGSCHAWGTVYHDPPGMPRLSMSVRYLDAERAPAEWDMAGEQGPEGIVFTKPKFRLVYSQGHIRGNFQGRMAAKIRLGPPQDGNEAARPTDADRSRH